ncbi:Flagellar hook protein FlgE [Lentibacillus sp. JNUCC-1]|uniref:flagellar hook-basal body protein n=1 Tax=Lentibacillus sp. JNUCC-1 TaxID=2654513 RepID=UPI0012E98054|nr:flagellar hook-basal body protein [Lentibacillus sp. JNUCC-1]MUV37363.1 Flagellar hook protein FlgE [Lentibacillus sp. JNUCC-1]
MSQTMIQAAVTMRGLQQKLDVIGHNMSNSQTTGYKHRQADFSSLLFQQINNMTDPANAEGRVTPDGIRIGSGAKLDDITIDLTPGAQKPTDRELDTALLKDNHLFQIQVTENGTSETLYTRDGAFYLSPMADGSVLLTTKDGNPVLGENGPIEIANGFDDIAIQPNGVIEVSRQGVTETAGRLAIVEAVRPRLLETAGANAFRMPDAETLGYNFDDVIQVVNPQGDLIKSGALEASNVDVAKQMTDMMMTQRAYQFNARTISMSDQMSGLVNQLRS